MKKARYTEETARRVLKATAKIERGSRDMGPTRLPRAPGDDGYPLRLCKTTGAWDVGTVATLDVWEAGVTPDEEQSGGSGGETLEATNHLWDVGPETFCLVMYGGAGAYYLVNAYPLASTCEEEGS